MNLRLEDFLHGTTREVRVNDPANPDGPEIYELTIPPGTAPGTRFRLGGMVEQGSLTRGENLAVSFKVSDGNATLPVTFKGILPDLFREGQGVVAEGAIDSAGVFKADTVLAKHDENYMPKEVADALKAQGRWQEGTGGKPVVGSNAATPSNPPAQQSVVR